MNYMKIYKSSLADGEGWRVVLFLSGCDHECKGCHNPQSWNAKAGKEFTDKIKEQLFSYITPEIDGLTLSGGDPLYKANREEVLLLCKEFKEKFPNKSIWLYTGYKYNDIKDLEILDYIDILVDGEFKEELKDTTLPFRGSSNQKIIHIKKKR